MEKEQGVIESWACVCRPQRLEADRSVHSSLAAVDICSIEIVWYESAADRRSYSLDLDRTEILSS